MTTDTFFSTLDIETLRSFTLLHAMSNAQLERIVSSVEIEQAPAGHLLLKRGSRDEYSFLLLDGHIRLRAEDGKINDVRSSDPSAKNPISQLTPRRYDVVSVTPVRFLRLSNTLLKELTSSRTTAAGGGDQDYQVSGEQQEESTAFENQISDQFLDDLKKDQLQLPSLPEVAVRIGHALADNTSDAVTIAEMIQTDPVITAKLIKAANSALYGRRTPVETCAGAVIRLGGDVTHKLIVSFTARELFNSESALLQRRMQELWRHSTQVAAICFVLAKHDSRFDPERAMLIGLLHDIGVVSVLNYAQGFPMESRQPEAIDQAIKQLRAQTGSMILRSWGFPMEFVIAALEGEDWHRDKGLTPDYCDLVIIAQLHSFIGTEHALAVPAINEVPAHARLALGELTPKMTLKILDEARDQIAHAEALLNS